jgi:hypothetical protein
VKRLLLAVLLLLTATGAAPRPLEQEGGESAAFEPLSASRCRQSCNDCKQRCARHKDARDRRDCELNCYDVSAACCEANGTRPWYRSCGCH